MADGLKGRGWLILSRDVEEEIVIGTPEGEVMIKVIELRDDKVRLAIDAPDAFRSIAAKSTKPKRSGASPTATTEQGRRQGFGDRHGGHFPMILTRDATRPTLSDRRRSQLVSPATGNVVSPVQRCVRAGDDHRDLAERRLARSSLSDAIPVKSPGELP